MPPPQPFPYQGSKRAQTDLILRLAGEVRGRLIEPFAGSGAVSLAWLSSKPKAFVLLNDSDRFLMDLWIAITKDPGGLCADYRRHYELQQNDPRSYFIEVRARFNHSHAPADLLYLMNRCVKGAVRYNGKGDFNQGADHRRLGARPEEVERRIFSTSRLLDQRSHLTGLDFAQVLVEATPEDLVYMDPPYQGTSAGPDGRYRTGLSMNRLVEQLHDLVRRNVPFILSYDGHGPNGSYGESLPESLAKRIEVNVGRSAQATLLGRNVETVESLYVSVGLAPTFESRVSAKHSLQPSLL